MTSSDNHLADDRDIGLFCTKEDAQAFAYSNPTWRCPVCKAESQDSLQVMFTDLRGNYCMRCWAEWISKNIPKLERIDGDKP